MSGTITDSLAFSQADPGVQDNARSIDAALTRVDNVLENVKQMILSSAASPITWSLAPGMAVAYAALDDAQDKTASTVSTIVGFLEYTGRPSYLESVADVWLEQVTTPVSNRMDLFTEGGMDVDLWWKGKAHDEYVAHLPQQYEALNAVKERAKNMADALDAFARAITGFWHDLRTQVIDVVDKYANVLGSVDMTAPWKVLATFASELVTLVDNLWKAVNSRYGEFKEKVGDIGLQEADQQGFPNGHWPGPHLAFERPTWTPAGEV